MTRSYRIEGIVIKRCDVFEADRIVTVFSKNLGKIQIKAAGIRRITSKRSAHVELFNHAVFGLYRGKSIPILTEVDSIRTFSSIKSDLSKIAAAYHICELTNALCAYNQENEEVFVILKKTLEDLENKGNSDLLIKQFERNLLSSLGFASKSQSSFLFNTEAFIENLIERKLKSRRIFSYIA